MSDTDVIVVGAGPAGALLALLLASRGVRTTLVERQTDFEREFRGEVLMPSGLAMLQESGIDIHDVAHIAPRDFRFFAGARQFLAIDAAAVDGPLPLIVSQPALLELLVARAAASPRFEFLRGAAVRGLEVEDGRVVGVRVQAPDGERQLRARLVVGADGRASVVRRRLGVTVRDLGAPMDIVWVKLPWPEAWDPGHARAYVGGGHLLIVFHAADGGLQLAWVILKGHYGELRARGIEEWVAEMQRHVCPELAAHLAAHVSNLSRPFLLDAVTDRVEGWARPGSLLIGDAAHTMSPVGGQGLNVAMRDAVVAANHLVPAFRGGTDLDAAASRVEPERGPEIDRIQYLAAQPPRIVLGTRFYHAWVRAIGTRLVGLPFAGRRAGAVADLFLNGATKVRLEI